MAITKQQVLDMAKTSNNKDTLDVLVQANKDEINEKLLTNPNITKNQFFAIINHSFDSQLVSFYQSNQGEIRRHISQYNADSNSELINIYIKHFKNEFTSDEINQMLLNLEENCIPIIIENNLEVKMNRSLYVKYILKYFEKYRSHRYSHASYSEWASNLDHDILDEIFKSDNNSFIFELLRAIKIETLSNDELQLLYNKQDVDILRVLAPVVNRITIKSLNPNDILENIKAYLINHNKEIDIQKEIVNLKTYRNTFDKDFYEELASILTTNCGYKYSASSINYTFFSIIPIDILVSLSTDVSSIDEFRALDWKNMTIDDFKKLVNKFPKCDVELYQLYIQNTNNTDQKEMLINEILSNENINIQHNVLYDITPEQLLQFILKDDSYINIIDKHDRYKKHPDFFEKDLDIIYKNKNKLAKYNAIMLRFIRNVDSIKSLPEIFIEFYNTELEGFSSTGRKQLYSEEWQFIDHNLLKLKPKLVSKDLDLDRIACDYTTYIMRTIERTDCPLEILEYFNTCSGAGSNKIKQIIRKHPTYVDAHKVEHVEKDDIDDVRDIIRIAISRGIIRQSDKDDLGITRDDDTIRDIWKSLVDQEFISNKQQKYVDLAKMSIK